MGASDKGSTRDAAARRPKLRPVEVVRYQARGQDMFCIRDATRLSERELHVSPDVFFIASLFDGERDYAGIKAEFAERFNLEVNDGNIKTVADALDEAHFLEGPEFEKWRAGLEEEFRGKPVREWVLAGGSYPEDPRDLPAFLEKFFVREGGPGAVGERPGDATPLRGLVAPHIDMRRGGVGFAHAHKALWETTRPEVVVILAVAHAGRGDLLTFTRKEFETPFGRLTTDVELVERLAAAAGESAFRDEYTHKAEHSVEIQLPWLQYLYGDKDREKDETPRIIPVLCGSLGECMASGGSPRELEPLARVTGELGAVIAERPGRAVVIASADLAHIGHRFGDEVPITQRLLRKNEECDREMLSFVEAGDADGFFEYVRHEEDRRRICGLTPVYATLLALEAAGERAKGRLLHYEQSEEDATQSVVSFASLALE